MPWIEKTVDCGNVKFVKRYFSTRYGTKGQVFRNGAVGTTSEAQERINDKNKIERFNILSNANFYEGDYFLTFTYKRENRPDSLETAKDQWTKLLRKLRALYKKNGTALKYLWCLEYKNNVYHFHMLCNNDNINSKEFQRLWKYGSINIKCLDDRAYNTVGEYMMKEQFTKEEKTKPSRCYGSSKNLYKPEPQIKILNNGEWDETPVADAGYTLDDDSLENGEIYIEDIDVSFRYQAYRLLKQKIIE